MPPEELSPHRLSREELALMQRKALREWHESDWLAEHKPGAWQSLRDDGMIRVDLGGGIGESEQKPGYISLDKDTMSKTDLAARSGETRLPDIVWDLQDGLPFEDESVDVFHASFLLRQLPDHTIQRLAKEIHRTLRTAGRVQLRDDRTVASRLRPLLLDHGFAIEVPERQIESEDSPAGIDVTLAKVSGTTTDSAPLRDKEVVMGETIIPEPRMPVP